jgi:hypothetical protein
MPPNLAAITYAIASEVADWPLASISACSHNGRYWGRSGHSAIPPPGRAGPESKKMKVGFSRVFTFESDGRPILAFEASGTREAQQLCKESWLLNDLSFQTSGGVRVRTAKSKLTVRLASPDEATVFALVANSTDPSDDMVLAYLVELDGSEAKPS